MPGMDLMGTAFFAPSSTNTGIINFSGLIALSATRSRIVGKDGNLLGLDTGNMNGHCSLRFNIYEMTVISQKMEW